MLRRADLRTDYEESGGGGVYEEGSLRTVGGTPICLSQRGRPHLASGFPAGGTGGRGGFIEVGEDGRCLSEHCEGQARARGKYLRRGVA